MDPQTILSWLVFYVLLPFLSAAGGYLFQRKRDIELLQLQTKQQLRLQREQFIRSDILPTIWATLTTAINETESILVPTPPLWFGDWSDEQLIRFLSTSPLTDTDKQEVLKASNKEAHYSNLEATRAIQAAFAAIDHFFEYASSHKLDIDQSLFSKLAKLHNCLIFSASVRITANATHDIDLILRAKEDFDASTKPLVLEIEQQMRQALNS